MQYKQNTTATVKHCGLKMNQFQFFTVLLY
jgi:hypothetical protein